MGDHSPRSPVFPTKCARCGGRLSGAVFSFCPHCGVPARLAFGEAMPSKKPDEATRSATARSEGARADIPLGELLCLSRPTPLFDTADQDPYGHVRPRGGARHWGVKAITALTSLAFVVLYGAAVLLHRHDDNATREEEAASRTAQGRVTTIGVNESNQAPTTAQAPTITAVAPSLPGPLPSAVPRPAQPSSSRSQNERASLANSTTTDKQYGDRNRKLMSLALARAHSGLENNDLHMARSGVYWALSLQPNNGEAIKLKQDLLLRERARLQH